MKDTILTLINKRSLKTSVSQLDRWIYENGVKISALANR